MSLEEFQKQFEYETAKLTLNTIFEKMLESIKYNGTLMLKNSFPNLSNEEQEKIVYDAWKTSIENAKNKIVEPCLSNQKCPTREEFLNLDFKASEPKPTLTKEEFLNLTFSSLEDDGDSFEHLYNEDPSEKLADESALHKLGYTVSQEKGLSAKQRQEILEFAINSKMMTKRKVISFLEYLIKTNGKKKTNEIAVSKWKEDLEYIKRY